MENKTQNQLQPTTTTKKLDQQLPQKERKNRKMI